MTQYKNGTWGRPNPSRLNDCAATVAKGTYPWTYVRSGNKMPNMLTLPEQAENVFDHRSPNKFSKNTGPGSEDIKEACTQIPKGC